jgi:hypothetical protein
MRRRWEAPLVLISRRRPLIVSSDVDYVSSSDPPAESADDRTATLPVTGLAFALLLFRQPALLTDLPDQVFCADRVDFSSSALLEHLAES